MLAGEQISSYMIKLCIIILINEIHWLREIHTESSTWVVCNCIKKSNAASPSGMCMDWELETYNVLGDHKQGRVGLCFISNFKNGNISSREHILVTFQEIVMLLRP